MIGAILAIPFFIIMITLEEGIYTGDNGICPYHKYKEQMTVDPLKTICENVRERGIPDGKITGGGFTCVNGVYYQTNYHCITNKIGLFTEQEGEGNPSILFWWIFLMEFYGILFGGIIGFIIYLINKESARVEK